MYIPDGYGTVFPYVFVTDAKRYLAFLERAFGARVLGVTEGPGGEVANARVRIGTTRFMVSDTMERFPPSQSAFYLYVDDADAVHAQAIACGAVNVIQPMDMPYGERQGGVTDPAGNTWWVTRRLIEEPYD